MDEKDKLIFLTKEVEIMKEALEHGNLQYAEVLRQLNENLEAMTTDDEQSQYNNTVEENTQVLNDEKEKFIKEIEAKKTELQGKDPNELLVIALKDIDQKITSTDIKMEKFMTHLLEEKKKLGTQEAIDHLSKIISSLERSYNQILNDLELQADIVNAKATPEEILAYLVSQLDTTIEGFDQLHSRVVTEFERKRDAHFARINVTPTRSQCVLPAPRSENEKRLSVEIQNVERNIENINKTTQEAIASLEEQKRQLRDQSDHTKRESQINLEITDIKAQHKLVLEKMEETHDDAKKRKMSLELLDQTIADMDREISRIQHEHDALVIELEQKKQLLRERLSSIEKLDLLINVLTYKIYEAQHDYRKDMEDLMKQREKLLARTDLTDSEITLGLAELDKMIADRQNIHEGYMLSLRGQRQEIRQESDAKMRELDDSMDTLSKQRKDALEALEAKKFNATPSELIEINRLSAELKDKFHQEIDDLINLQQAGWKETNSEERLLELLDQRGLRVTKSGRILTGSGRLLSHSEAVCLGLLDGLEARWDKITALRASLKVESEGSTNESSREGSSSGQSSGSQISSEDVCYLKSVLGKPLVLALAEITAKQPKDPVHYLGHWLYKYRYNQEIDITRKRELRELMEAREKIAQDKWHETLQEEARAAVLEIIMRAEEEATRREIERELLRIAREAAFGEEEDGTNLDAETKNSLGIYGVPPTKAA